MLKVVETLTAAGMSSDESESEDGVATYRIKKLAWRNRALTPLLKRINEDYNPTNAFGKLRPGNKPRNRKRGNGMLSMRDPPTGLPLNYYDRYWYDGLTNKQKHDLGASRSLPIPELEED